MSDVFEFRKATAEDIAAMVKANGRGWKVAPGNRVCPHLSATVCPILGCPDHHPESADEFQRSLRGDK